MELVLIFFLIPLGAVTFAIIYSTIQKHEVSRGRRAANIFYNQNHHYDQNQDKVTILKIVGFIGIVIIGIFIISKLMTSNPIIGKWQSETTMPFMGKSVSEIEFTKDKEYSMGMVSNVDYEIDGDKVIVTDEMKIGIVYEMIDKNTMKSNMLGMETIYRRLK